MKKIYGFMKKWSYLGVWLLCGILFLSFFDREDVYGRVRIPMSDWLSARAAQVKSGMEKWISEEILPVNPSVEDRDGMLAAGEKEQEEDGGEDTSGEPGDPQEAVPAGEQADTEEPFREGTPEVEYMTVDEEYFRDAVFIGDSRTVGMYEYGGLEDIATFYASKGLTIYEFFDDKIVSLPDQKTKITIEEALQQNQFSKIYLMLGINEMGGRMDTFVERYQQAIDRLHELMPDAIIYIQAIMKVSTKRSEQGDYITNEGIIARNEEIEKMADNVTVFFLDVNPLICDESGGMNEEYTTDGVHLKAKYIQIWKEFLMEHAIKR